MSKKMICHFIHDPGLFTGKFREQIPYRRLLEYENYSLELFCQGNLIENGQRQETRKLYSTPIMCFCVAILC